LHFTLQGCFINTGLLARKKSVIVNHHEPVKYKCR
jgi:hypothetical protein